MPTSKTYAKQTACSDNHVTNLLISAAVGSVVGASAALLLTPKSGERLRKDITNTYQDLTDKTQDFAENIKETASQFISPENNSHLLLGALGGGILVATAVYLLGSQED
jgi:ABC-type enterobactin transport system permease subunit